KRAFLSAGVSAAALLLLVWGLWAFALRPPQVVAYVTMDVNPSVEMGLDAKEKVRKLRAVNEDAKPIIAGLIYRGKDVETVTEEIAEKLVAAHILNVEDGEVVIASVPMRTVADNWEQGVTAKMKQAIETASKPGLEIMTVSLPREVRDEAKANGISA